MEKIQAAIAKARANRSTAVSARTETRRNVAPPVQSLEPNPADLAFATLPALQARPQLFEQNRLVAFQGGPASTEIDVLRTRLLQHMRANGWHRIAITSPGPQCGKSTVAANLGFSLSRQAEQRTIVLDLDLQKPNLARTLGISECHDMAAVLDRQARFEDNALRYGTNLAFATAARPVPKAAELLQSPKATATIAAIEAQYEPTVMVFDMPPMLIGDAAMAFMAQVDCVLLVAAAEFTTVKEIDSCERELASQTNVLGVVLNKCRYMDRDSGYGAYGYS